jgi:hypothetical protein
MPHTPGTAITAPVPAAGDAWATREGRVFAMTTHVSVAAEQLRDMLDLGARTEELITRPPRPSISAWA